MKDDLIQAALCGDARAVKTLLGKGARVNQQAKAPILFGKNTFSISRCTPLIAAMGEGHATVVKMLLEAGADPNQKAGDDDTALHVAALLGRKEMISLLVQAGADVNAKSKSADTPLLAALSMDHFNAAVALIQAGADVKTRDRYLADTPLHRAVYTEKVNDSLLGCIRELIRAGADVNAQNDVNQAPLHYAAMGSPQLVSILLEHGANPATPDFLERTPLFLSNDAESTRLLIKAGSPVNHMDDSKETPLFEAIRRENYEIILELIRGVADVNCSDRFGTSLIDVAAKAKDKRIYELIRQSSGKNISKHTLNEFLCKACKSGNAKEVQKLLAKGADANAKLEWTPALTLGAESGNEEVVKLLLEAGARIKEATTSERTALHVAAEGQSKGIVRRLLDAGGDIHKKDTEGATPLLQACSGGNGGIIRLLIQRGADIHAKTKDGMEPLLIAARYGHREAAHLLMKEGATHPHASHFLEVTELPLRVKKQKDFQKAVRQLMRITATKPLRAPKHFGGGVFFEVSKTKLAKSNEKELAKTFLKELLIKKTTNAEEMAKKIAEMHATDKTIHEILDLVYTEFLKRGFLVLFVHQLPGNKLGVLPTANPYAAVLWLGPHPRGPLHMLEFLLKLSRDYRWKLIGCSYDEIRIRFEGKPANPLRLATQLYGLRSDEKGIVSNGVVKLANSKKDFARMLQTKNPLVRLWWD